jgi:hypothetical protein
MNLQENIKRILREETQIPSYIKRRLKFYDNLIDLFKQNSIRYYNLKDAAYYTADSMISYDDEEEFFNNEGYHEEIAYILGDYLIDKYGDEVRDYLNSSIPEGSFDDDGYNYVFWKHSERYGGNGFSESYPTWGNLIIKRGYWFPINWGEIKSDLDNKGETDLLILTPSDKHNSMGYFFSIRKIKKK